jgi:hypothetical protein
MGLYITYLNMSNYTDKRTGIVYTNIGIRSAAYGRSAYDNAVPQPHLDAFIPPAFLKTYF